MAENEVAVIENQTIEIPASAPDFCAVQTVHKVEGVVISPRCALCYQREGNPGDCDTGDRFAISFGAAGGVVLCRKAMNDLINKLDGVGFDVGDGT